MAKDDATVDAPATLDNGTSCPADGYCQNCGKTVEAETK